MMKLTFLLLIISICMLTVVIAATQFAFDNDHSKGVLRFDFELDQVLYAGSVGAAYRTKGDNAAFHWVVVSGVVYLGDDQWFNGNYELEVEIKPFFRSEEATFEGPVESNQEDLMTLSITPPPQNKDIPDIELINGKAEIKGGGMKAKATI